MPAHAVKVKLGKPSGGAKVVMCRARPTDITIIDAGAERRVSQGSGLDLGFVALNHLMC